MRREEKRRGWMEAAHGGKDWAKEGRRWGRGGVVPSTCMGVKPPAPHLISPGLGQTALLISADPPPNPQLTEGKVNSHSRWGL